MTTTPETTTEAVTLAVDDADWVTSHVEPGTPFVDDPSEMVLPGWYVLGCNDEESHDVVVRVERAVDINGDDASEYVANLIAERLRGVERERLYGQALKETAKAIGYIGTPEVIPDKVRDLIHSLRAENHSWSTGSRLNAKVTEVEKEQAEARERIAGLGADIERIRGALEDLAKARAEVERLTAENAELRQALAKAERHDADIRFEAEGDVRAELAEKAGA